MQGILKDVLLVGKRGYTNLDQKHHHNLGGGKVLALGGIAPSPLAGYGLAVPLLWVSVRPPARL